MLQLDVPSPNPHGQTGTTTAFLRHLDLLVASVLSFSLAMILLLLIAPQ